MTKEEFLQCLNYLKAYYPNWNLGFENVFVLNVWYDNFKNNVEFESMLEIVKKYCVENKFPPNSPTDLLNIIPEVFENGIEAWEEVYEIIKKSRNNFEFLNNISRNLPELYDFVKNFDIENVEIDKNGNKCYGYEYEEVESFKNICRN